MQQAVITWASSWIWKAIATEFIKKWYSVVAHYRNNKWWVGDLIKLWNEYKVPVFTYWCELSEENEVKKLYAFVRSCWWIDYLINNAWWYLWKWDEWNWDVWIWWATLVNNLFPVLLCSKYFWEYFLEQKKGCIVNISSCLGSAWHTDCISYSAAKAWIINISQAYAKLLAPYCLVNTVSPGPTYAWHWTTASPKDIEENISEVPFGKLITPEEIARVVYNLCVQNNSVTGQNILIDWGYSLV